MSSIQTGHRSVKDKVIQMLGYATAIAWEARCAWLLESELPNFVLGEEGSSADCGLLVTDGTLPTTKVTERFLAARNEYGENALAVLLDFKTINPNMCCRFKGGLYFYCFYIAPKQRLCAAFVIQNPAAPHLVALLPQYYVERCSRGRKTGRTSCYGRETPLSGGEIEPFPMEWSPFIMPLHVLPEALRLLYAFYRGSRQVWTNPFNGLAFTACPTPVARSLEYLRPEDSSFLTDGDMLNQIKSAFELHSTKYQVERPTIRPSVGDFLIVCTESLTTVTVELKRNLASISSAGELQHVSGRRVRRSTRTRRYFTPLAQWDFLLTSCIPKASMSTVMVFLSRDDLPQDWFEQQSAEWLHWTPDGDFLKSHTVTQNLGKSFVHQMEQILDGYQASSGLCAKIQRPFTVVPHQEILVQVDDESDDDSDDDDVPSRPFTEARALRGSGPRWSRTLFETLHEDWIRGQCVKHNFGTIYRLGRHPSGSHVFTSCVADSFADLDLEAPMIYLNFAPISHLHQLVPGDKRRPNALLHATHGSSPSMYLLTAAPPNLEQLPHDYYLVPSTTLDTPYRAEIGRKILDDPRVTRPSSRLYLSQGELIDVYAVPEDEVLNCLRRIFKQALDAEHLQMGDLDTEAGVAIKLDHYFVTKRDVLREYISLLHGESFWGNNIDDNDSDGSSDEGP